MLLTEFFLDSVSLECLNKPLHQVVTFLDQGDHTTRYNLNKRMRKNRTPRLEQKDTLTWIEHKEITKVLEDSEALTYTR